ncbi:hypothetical protein IWW37_005017 [Coemansia sp. RSA 2050]|nr:hypothetical protein IWW37_005017 [Coemansia sp. RSA 2050]KAJ2730851.1 hypothetical protein IW152_004955 [Coemansia sp. BCRC 34962]
MSGLESATSPAMTVLQRAKPPSPILSTAADQILIDALCKSTDRAFLLDIEQQVIDFIDSPKLPRLSYPKQNSYRRLLLHKLADYYSLSHVVAGRYRDEIVFYRKPNQSGECLPELLATVVPVGRVVADENEGEMECRGGEAELAVPVASPGFTKILVKKRGPAECVDLKKRGPVNSPLSPDTVVYGPVDSSPLVEDLVGALSSSTDVDACCDKLAGLGVAGRTKTIEQRQAEYERARAEIFQDDETPKLAVASGSSSPVAGQHLRS